jgi:hypothetical protein
MKQKSCFGRVPKYWDCKIKKGLGTFKSSERRRKKVSKVQPPSRDGIKIEPEDAVRVGNICEEISGLKNHLVGRSASVRARPSRDKEKVTLHEQDRVNRRERI